MKSLRLITFLLSILFISCEENKTVIQDVPFDFESNNLSPNLVAGEDYLGLSWLHVEDGKPSLYYNQFRNNAWQTPRKIAEGGDWFVNWADFPANAVNGDLLLTSYLEKSADGTFTYDIRLNLQKMDGTVLRENFLLNTDGVKAEHGFVSMLPNEEGGFYVSWLDGRNTGGGSHVGGHGSSQGAMTIRTAEITAEGEIVNEVQLDSRACDCCQTDMTMTKTGPIVVYRDRSERETRDIYFTQKIGQAWTEPKAVFNDGWIINGCPVNGPKVVSNDENVAVAWFTAAFDRPQVLVAFSKNGVVKFDTPVVLNDDLALGRVDIAFIDEKSVLVSYMESDETDTYLKVRKVKVNGRVSEAHTVAKISGARGTGVPQLEILGDEAFIMWTDQKEDSKQLKAVKFSIENL